MTAVLPSHVYPRDSEVRDGRLLLGGCDAALLAERFGTPAYVVCARDVQLAARDLRDGFVAAGAPEAELAFASKAFPCTAVLRLLQAEGYGCDVASAGELALAVRAGFPGTRIHLHGNAKGEAELVAALRAGVGHVVLDGFDDLERLAAVVAAHGDGPGERQDVLLRVTPDVRGATHDGISTGQADAKFGFSLEATAEAIRRLDGHPHLRLRGLHAHIGSQLLELEPFVQAVDALAPLMGDLPLINLGGGLGVAYTRDDEPPSAARYAAAKVDAVRRRLGAEVRIADEPGRSLVARAGVTLYTVQTVKRNVSTWVAVDGGMADNLRPMLYGARYEAHVADRLDVHELDACRLVGKHCESSDVLVADARLPDPRPGDVVVTPVTGAYGHAMANTYNGVPRPPVVLVQDGTAREVVRRERLDELWARDVDGPLVELG